jgi:hypothetical protein
MSDVILQNSTTNPMHYDERSSTFSVWRAKVAARHEPLFPISKCIEPSIDSRLGMKAELRLLPPETMAPTGILAESNDQDLIAM